MANQADADATVDTAKKSTGENQESKSIAEEAAEIVKTGEETTSESPVTVSTPAVTEEPESQPQDTQGTTEDDTSTEQTDGDEIEEDLVESFIDTKKDGKQKRIDKLTAQLRSVQEELAGIRSNKPTTEESAGEKIYTDAQLRTAMAKAVEENDAGLIFEINQHMVANAKRELREEYASRNKKQQEEAKRNNAEWTEIVSSYEHYGDAKQPELYAGSHKELNIKDANSLLRQVALAYYTSSDEELFQLYRKPGGQARAITDAFNSIMKKRLGLTTDTKETRTLKRKLSKERRKKSLTSSSNSVKPEATQKVKRNLSRGENLDEYLKDRTRYQSERAQSGQK